MENKLYISMYHYTRDLVHSRYPEIKGLAYDLFEKQLQFFSKNFSVVTMEEVIGAIHMNRWRGGETHSCLPLMMAI